MAVQPSSHGYWFPQVLDSKGNVDPQLLNQALKRAFDSIYSLAQTASGVALVIGSKLSISTGLAVINSVVVSVDPGPSGSPVGEWAMARVSATVKGAFDVFVFAPTSSGNNTPILSTTQRSVRWFAANIQPLSK